MKWLLNILKSRVFLVSIGVLLAVVLIVLVGEMLGDDTWIYRLLAFIVLLMLTIVILVIRFARANRSADEIEKSIKQQAQQQRISARPDKQAEIQELETQLDRAIEQLKQSKLGGGKRGRAALYALPWYLFVGPPGAGKTTAIANSGLTFPLGNERIRGVGGTRNCDWFFSDRAILLDTAGRYMTEQEDTEEWLAFLDTLKQHRSDRPINGVIVGIALPDLAIATPDEIEWHADNIRRRADELVRHLGVKFPVYLVFTKSDMLQGFVEFFGEYSRREREQIWGATLDQAQQESADLRAVFEEEFDRLAGSLVELRMARLSRPMKREERQKVYAFPLQMASIKENLALFVGRLFQPNPYQENPIFRGFYFTSGTQEGVPLDRVILAIARQFELSTTGLHQFETQEETKSYFIKDLFTEVIVPDQYMVQRTSKARRAGSFRRVGATVAAAALLGLFVLVTALVMAGSRRSLSRTDQAVASANLVSLETPNTVFDDLGRVEALREQVYRLEESVWFGLGLNRNSTVRRPARALYLQHVRAFVGEYPVKTLRDRMRRAINMGNVAGSERDSLYDDLKAYLLLGPEQQRLEDDANHDFLVRHLTNLGLAQLTPHVSSVQVGDLDARVRNQVTEYVDALRGDARWTFAPETNLIAAARSRIVALPGIEGLYLKLRNEGRDQLQAYSVKLENAVPPRYHDLFRSTAEVSGFYTKQGWESFVVEKVDELSEDPTGEDWVVGRSSAGAREEFGNKDQIEEALVQRYFQEYAREWQRFIQGVRVDGFTDLRDAAVSLRELGDEYQSPLAFLLARVTQETRFIEPEDQQESAQESVVDAVQRRLQGIAAARLRLRMRGRIRLGTGEETHLVDQSFARLHRLKADLAESGAASGELYSALQHLREVGNTLDEKVGDDAQVERYAAEVLAARGGELDGHVREIQRALRGIDEPLREQLFEVPVRAAWGTVMGIAQRYLNEQWRLQVREAFERQLAGRYPFQAGAADAPLSDVQQFFLPQSGVVDNFIATYLQPYLIREDVGQPQRWLGRGLELSRDAVQAIQKARSISGGLFRGSSLGVSFRLTADQPVDRSSGAPAPASATISLHGRSDTYLMGGRRAQDFDWPGTAGGASLSLSTEQGPLPELRFEGDWALFRLFEAARIQCRTGTSCDVRWPFEGAGFRMSARYDLERPSTPLPFDNLRGFFTFQPPNALN